MRERRIAVEDGALIQRDGASTRVLAPKGTVTRMLVIDPAVAINLVPPRKRAVCGLLVDTHGVALVLAGDRPVLAIRLGEWLPCPERKMSDRDARRLTGIDAVAAALGVPLEYGDAATVEPFTDTAASALVETSPRLPRGFTFASWCALLAFVAVFVLRPLIDRGSAAAEGAAIALLAIATARAVVLAGLRLDMVKLHRGRGAAVAGLRVVRPVPAPGSQVARGFARTGALYLSDDMFVLVGAAGEEAWIPGPGAGGISRATVNHEFVTLDDASGTGLASISLESWAGTGAALEALRQRLGAFGIPMAEEPLVRHPGGGFASAVFWLGIDSSLFALQDIRDARGLPFLGGILTFAALPCALIVPAQIGIPCAAIMILTLVSAGALSLRDRWLAQMIPVPDGRMAP